MIWPQTPMLPLHFQPALTHSQCPHDAKLTDGRLYYSVPAGNEVESRSVWGNLVRAGISPYPATVVWIFL